MAKYVLFYVVQIAAVPRFCLSFELSILSSPRMSSVDGIDENGRLLRRKKQNKTKQQPLFYSAMAYDDTKPKETAAAAFIWLVLHQGLENTFGQD